ncbi:MAG: hypothetical protein ABSG54_09165 [Terriglobia bacterium]|jgi:hypothetical protein
MNRHLSGAYVLGTIELLLGCPMAFGGWQLGVQVYRHPNPRADDFLAASALAFAGVAILVAASATLLHAFLPFGVVRGAHIAAATSEVWMVLAGVGIIMVGREHGGDWPGFTILGGSVFSAAGILLLLFSFFGLRYLRRLRG